MVLRGVVRLKGTHQESGRAGPTGCCKLSAF
jgi:hypothetical protein